MKYIVIFSLLFIFCSVKAQSFDEILKNKAKEACQCFTNIDYIDSRGDYETKLDACKALNKQELKTIDLKSNLREFNKLLDSVLFKNCTIIEEKFYKMKRNTYKGISDSIYTLEKQNLALKKKVVGYYRSLGLIISSDNKYVKYNGLELEKGTWRIYKEKFLHLNQDKYKQPFMIYGRHNLAIGDSTKTNFASEFSGGSQMYIHYGKPQGKLTKFRPILNANYNCMKFPNVATVAKKHNEISIADKYDITNLNFKTIIDNNHLQTYTFKNPENYNDFIIYETVKIHNSFSKRFVIDDGKLILERDQIFKKGTIPLPNTDEFYDYLFKEFSKKTVYPTAVYYNLYGNAFNNDTEVDIVNSKFYTHDTTLNEFNFNVNLLDEYHKLYESYKYDDDYPEISLSHKPDKYDYALKLFEYRPLDNVTTKMQHIEKSEKSMIYRACD